MSSIQPSILRRAYELGKPTGVLLFIVGACLFGPFASYAGIAVGNYAAATANGTALAVLGPILRVLGFLVTAGVIMLACGSVFGLIGFAGQRAARSVIRAIRSRQPSHPAGPGSGV